MFVYILKYNDGKRFKIGKANDIYRRIRGIGGMEAFDLVSSLCVQLQSEDEAYRIEKILHRLFADWRIEVDKGNRFEGDTEQFSIECFERVIKFLMDNADLTAGTMPGALPTAPVKVSESSTLDDEDRRRAKAEAYTYRIQELMQRHEKTLQILRAFTGYVSDGSMQCGRWNDPNGKEQYLFTSSGGGNSVGIFVKDLFSRDVSIDAPLPYTGGSRIICSSSWRGEEKDNGRFFSIHGLNVRCLYGFVNESERGINFDSRRAVDYASHVAALPQMRAQIEEMIEIIQRIPVIDDDGIFSLMQLGGVVNDANDLSVDGLLHEIRQVMLTLNQNEGKCFFSVDLGSDSSIDAWIMRYCAHGLASLGYSKDDISTATEAIRIDTKHEVARMPREVDDMFGGFIYRSRACGDAN